MKKTFEERKAERRKKYELKTRPCIACNGSGYYDSIGSTKCASCKGTGKEKYKPDKNDTN